MPFRTWISNAATALLVGCALVITGLLVRNELRGAPPAAPTYPPALQIDDWERYATGAWIGARDAPVRIVEFSDFECSFCRTLARRLAAVSTGHPGQVAIVYRHFPLPSHAHARAAARAATCADRQGRFSQMHDALFAAQDSLGAVAWPLLARSAGVADAAAFEQCLADPATDSVITTDIRAARALGIVATPTILVNDMRLIGAVPDDTLEAYVVRALARRGRPSP